MCSELRMSIFLVWFDIWRCPTRSTLLFNINWEKQMSLAWDTLPTVSQKLFSIKIQKLQNPNLNPEFKNHFDIQALWLKSEKWWSHHIGIAWTKLTKGSNKMAESEHLKCSNFPPFLLKAVKITPTECGWWITLFCHWRWSTVFLSGCKDFPIFTKQLSSSLLLWPNSLARALSFRSELCRQPEDLEGVEGGGEGDLLRGLVQVGRYHLHRHRQRARLVSLKCAISL